MLPWGFRGALGQLRIRLSLVSRFEGAEETVKLPRYISAMLIFAPHPIVFPSSYAGEGKRDGL